MLSLHIKTDQLEAKIYLYDGKKHLASLVWTAHLQLAETIHQQIDKLLHKADHTLEDIKGVVVFNGAGSFTGLRIGASVANALAYSLQIPVVGSAGKDWQMRGVTKLNQGLDDKIVIPNYGGTINISKRKK